MDEDDDDDEDKYGRYKGRMVTDSYKHRMLELEQQLGIKSRFTRDNTQDEDDDSDPNDEGIGRVVISGSPSKPGNGATAPAPTKSIVKDKSSDKSDVKKGVRFAQGLDVAPEPSPAPASAATPAQKSDVVEPLGDIVERTSTPKPAEAPAPAPRKQSRFKQARTNDFIPKGPFDVSPNFIPMQSESAPVPTGPPGTTLAKTLVEKESVSTPMDPQDVDDSMLDSEVADEHQRMRRRFIQREGGFLKEDDSPVQQLDETEGGRERMSRFKAARLSRQ
jgi:unconventional prefoldin RPB5 interactor 1